ncbi:MAG: polysaccharide deacetylase family protein [SAR202 cluster bacterium]|jgi:peptidoglycan/xylan/chitin deacetylase (PgdA/CDA1 family)|nr:polysaccharide deacetylase family protein [SAR202 cluster bacterium]
MRIPITMCHGIRSDDSQGYKPLTFGHLDNLLSIASDLGFESITYDDLHEWRKGNRLRTERPIMLDFDHPVDNMRHEVHGLLAKYGYVGNIFIYTRPYDDEFKRDLPVGFPDRHMTWDELGEIHDAGWNIGAHTVSHPNLSELSTKDPTGDSLREELDRCNETILNNLGFMPQDFAFTGTSWSSIAEFEVKKRYRFGRLWIKGSQYQVDGKPMRYAELVGVTGPDESDGGPPNAARYITEQSDPFRLPSMELQTLINAPEAFRAYLEGALGPNS